MPPFATLLAGPAVPLPSASRSSSPSRAVPCPGEPRWGGAATGPGQPGGTGQQQFVLINPMKNKEMKWQERVINQSVPRPISTFPAS